MSSRRPSCPFCLEADCLCEGTAAGGGALPVPECDAHLFGAAATFTSLSGGSCRCIVCPRCGHHTGNATQGHYWASCRVLRARVREGLAPGETLSAAELMRRATREFHFCCPAGCELEEDGEPGEADPVYHVES